MEQPNLVAPVDVPALSVRFWVLVVATGVLAGLAGAALMALLHAVAHLTYSYRSGSFLAAVEQAGAPRRVVALAVAGAVAGGGWWLLRWWTGPGGSEVSVALWRDAGRLPLRRSLGTAVLSVVIVGMGASLGREAAPRLAGAALASRLSDWARIDTAHRRLLAACGAGAGMACVYNVPLGGALLTLEVMLGVLSLRLALPALAASCIATAVSWTVLPTGPTYRLPDVPLSASLAVFAVLLGPLAGLAAVGWVRMIRIAHAHRPTGWRLHVAPLLVFTAVGALAVPYPQLLGNGKDIVQLSLGGLLAAPTLVALLFLKPIATAGSLGSGASGGLFTPTVATGALLGSLAGLGWTHLWPGPAAGFAVIGAAAVLAAAMQAPVAAVVLMLELTRTVDALMVPLLLAVTGAMLVSGRLDTPSIYSVRLPAQ
ncbi:chloride channel protein [Streptomyces pinistramenti]|uniref:chloride channel protein n=1 Tax=Streptomyces pinistramenti TaxID=2884812 RepID=UPI001D08445E|nr:chloride channel protein [Streptomyces pinistramenti]MCB5908243.1 chloride channel protein [Streptomyces pinistramenti]